MAEPWKRIIKLFSECMLDHAMLVPNDHVLVGLSGGKDSWILLELLVDLKKKAPFQFTISGVTVDGGLMGLEVNEFEKRCEALNVPFHLERQRLFEIVAEKKDPGSTFCSMCAKMRRGVLYSVAHRLGATKLALGHHLDDALETLLLNLFYGGKLAALPPVLLSDSGYVPVIRPLLYCEEKDIAEVASERRLSTLGCACPVCPTHPDHEHSDLKRHEMKRWVNEMVVKIPGLRQSARAALKNPKSERFFTRPEPLPSFPLSSIN